VFGKPAHDFATVEKINVTVDERSMQSALRDNQHIEVGAFITGKGREIFRLLYPPSSLNKPKSLSSQDTKMCADYLDRALCTLATSTHIQGGFTFLGNRLNAAGKFILCVANTTGNDEFTKDLAGRFGTLKRMLRSNRLLAALRTLRGMHWLLHKGQPAGKFFYLNHPGAMYGLTGYEVTVKFAL
jgi:hypothetical protein